MSGSKQVKKFPDEYDPPVSTKRKCKHCKNNLGCQDPGYVCSTCNFIANSSKRLGENLSIKDSGVKA